jgi:hypothetical protein
VPALLALRSVRQRTDSDEIKLQHLVPSTEPETVQRIWDSSGFYARIDGPSPSEGSALDGGHWRELYRAALLELDLEKLGERVAAAEEAIRARVSLNGGILNDERIAMQDATSALNVLRAGVKRSNPPFKNSGL